LDLFLRAQLVSDLFILQHLFSGTYDMANQYCAYLNSREGSAFNLGQFAKSTGLDKTISQLTKGVQERTGISSERIKNISTLSETNMVLLEENLKRLHTTISIYNVAGIFAASSGALGTILIGMKLFKHFSD
jgi:hypothetical protein